MRFRDITETPSSIFGSSTTAHFLEGPDVVTLFSLETRAGREALRSESAEEFVSLLEDCLSEK